MTTQAVTGSWWGLVSVFRQSKSEFEAYVSNPLTACPHDGEPLTNGPTTASGTGIERFCRFSGFAYPRVWTPPMRL